MGTLEGLKRLFEPGKPPFTVEPQCLRHVALTLRLPAGWQFTKNDGRNFSAAGPAGASAVFLVTSVNEPLSKYPPDEMRTMISKLVRDYVLRKQAVEEKVLPSGVLWFEAKGRIVTFNLRPRDPQILRAFGLDVTWEGGAETAEAVRGALRSVEWN